MIFPFWGFFFGWELEFRSVGELDLCGKLDFCVERERDWGVVSHSVREEKGKIDLDFLVNRELGRKESGWELGNGSGGWVGDVTG